MKKFFLLLPFPYLGNHPVDLAVMVSIYYFPFFSNSKSKAYFSNLAFGEFKRRLDWAIEDFLDSLDSL